MILTVGFSLVWDWPNTRGNFFKETDCSSSSSYQITIALQLGLKFYSIFLLLCWYFIWLDLVHVLYMLSQLMCGNFIRRATSLHRKQCFLDIIPHPLNTIVHPTCLRACSRRIVSHEGSRWYSCSIYGYKFPQSLFLYTLRNLEFVYQIPSTARTSYLLANTQIPQLILEQQKYTLAKLPVSHKTIKG